MGKRNELIIERNYSDEKKDREAIAIVLLKLIEKRLRKDNHNDQEYLTEYGGRKHVV